MFHLFVAEFTHTTSYEGGVVDMMPILKITVIQNADRIMIMSPFMVKIIDNRAHPPAVSRIHTIDDSST